MRCTDKEHLYRKIKQLLRLWAKFLCHTFFPSQDTKQTCYWVHRQLITSWTLRFIFDHPVLKQWPTGRKEGRTEIQKFEYLENEKSFVDEIKIIFHSFWRPTIYWKNKNLIKNSGHKLLINFKISMYQSNFYNNHSHSQSVFTCSKSLMETLKQCLKSIQS